MFKRPPRRRPHEPNNQVTTLTIHVDDTPIQAHPNDTAAAALIAAGLLATRRTPVTGAPRGPYCMMGACFDCLAIVDGHPSQQLCLTPVHDGMRIQTQHGPRTLASPP